MKANPTDTSQKIELKEECSDILQNIEVSLLKISLENDQQVIGQLFRHFHNIKGMAGFMSWPNMQKIASNTESILDLHRKTKTNLSAASIGLINRGADLVKNAIENDDAIAVDTLEQYTSRVTDHIANAKTSTIATTGNEISSQGRDEILDKNISNVDKINLILNSIDPDLKLLESGKISNLNLNKLMLDFDAINDLANAASVAHLNYISSTLLKFFQSFAKNAPLFSLILIKKAASTVDLLKGLLFLKGNTLPDKLLEASIEKAAEFDYEVDRLINSQQEEIYNRIENVGSFTFRIDVDYMMSMMNEIENLSFLVTKQYRAQSDKLSHQIYLHTTKINEMMHGATRIPLKQLFFRFGRVVKNAAELVNKDIQLFMSNENIEIDRNLLEPLNVAIIHILRNSCDHGIESTLERIKVGKSQAGRIDITPKIIDSQLVIEIKDDGRGLDRQKISSKLLELGWMTAEELKDLSDKEIYKQIFKPGFSTSQTVTDISGRGVGMDIVNKEISRLNGSILVDSSPGKGLKITLTLPYNIN